MKLNVMQTKIDDGDIEVEITVRDPGDYPTALIFSDAETIENDSKFVLDKSDTAGVTELFRSAKEARTHTAKFIEKIKVALDEWRKFEIDDVYTIEI